MSKLIPTTKPLREFKGHERDVTAVAVFPGGRRMVTCSRDKTVRLWDLKTGVVLKKMDGYSDNLVALAVSRDGQIIASGNSNRSGVAMVWHGETGEILAQPIKANSNGGVSSLDFSADGMVLAIAAGSYDNTVKFWCTKSWQQQGDQIKFDHYIRRVRYSPSGELLAIATYGNINIFNSDTRECVATFGAPTTALEWTPSGTRLIACGSDSGSVMQEWDTSTWEKVGGRWGGPSVNPHINTITINSAGTLVAAISIRDHEVCLWRLSDQRHIANFRHSSLLKCVTFSVDGKRLLTGGDDTQISEWEVPTGVHPKILAITPARNSCIIGELSTAEQLLTQEIDTDTNNYSSYAHRSFVRARKQDWDHALEDATKSITIRPSVIGYISEGIALCGKGQVRDARAAFDVASMFTTRDPEIAHFLLLIKAIALFNVDQHDEAMLFIKKLAAACPKSGIRACHLVEVYLRVQLGINALDGARHDEAADHFTAAVNSSTFSQKFKLHIHEIYEDLVALFGWDIESFWLTTHQKRCEAFFLAGKVEEALESHQHMMNAIDETEKASCLDWSNDFKDKCSALHSIFEAIDLFNADKHEEAILLIKELVATCPSADSLACRVVEAYFRVQLGINALDGARRDEAADHFTTAVNSSAFSSRSPTHFIYQHLAELFGRDLDSLWLTAHQKRCEAFLSAGKVKEALESHQHMMDVIDETAKASCLDWSNEFKKKCSALAAHDDRILGAEIPGQDQDGYDTGPDFFRGNHGHSQISRPRPQQRPGRFKKLWLAMTRSPHAPPPLTPAPPTTLPPATATFRAHIRHLFTWRSDHAAPPVVDVPFAQGRKRNAAAGAPADDDSDIIREEYSDDPPQDPNTQQQQQPVPAQGNTGEHGGGKSCFCC